MKTRQILFFFGVAFGLVACGGGSDAPPPEPVDRVVIDQSALLLVQAGQNKALSATALDASGRTLGVPVTWTSSRSASIAVDAAGTATAVGDGSSQIVASAGGVRSAPLLGLVARPAAGAILLTDQQIVGEPKESVPGASPAFGNTYQVTLQNIAAPASGAIMLSTESKAVAGRVKAVDTVAGQTTVTLSLVPLREIFPTLSIRETIDLSQAPVDIPAAVLASHDVKRVGDTWTFTPKPVSAAKAVPLRERALAGAVGTYALPPFESCEPSFTAPIAGGALPFALSTPPTFSLTFNASLDLAYDPTEGLQRFVVRGAPVFNVEAGVTALAAFEGKAECKVTLAVYRIPIAGALSVFFSGLAPLGVGLDVGGKVTLASMGMSTKSETKTTFELGVACVPGGGCGLVRSLADFSNQVTPNIDYPTAADARLEASVHGFGFIDLEVGNPVLASLRFDTVTARAGAKFLGSFAPTSAQAVDPGYGSNYKVSLEASAGPGTNLGEVAQLLGLPSISAIQLSVSSDLGASPTGTVAADRHAALAGETLHLSVDLNEASTRFLAPPLDGIYNVRELLLVRQRGGGDAQVVARLPFGDGQTHGSFDYVAPDTTLAAELSVFVVTRVLPYDALKLELGSLRDIVIEQQPASAEAGVGGSVAFGVHVPLANAAKYTFQWRRNGVPIPGATAAGYTTPQLAAGDDGAVYTVVVGNAVGSVVSREALLSVTTTPAPLITAGPADTAVGVGNPASFSVTASSALPLTYQWSRNGLPIAGATGTSYTTPPTTTQDDGASYSVTVIDSAGRGSSAGARLTVLIGPTLYAQPADKVVFVRRDGLPGGQGALWSAQASGTGPMTYRYYRNGVQFGISENMPVDAAVIWGTGPLATADNGSKYWYTATNIVGTVKSREATVTTLPELF